MDESSEFTQNCGPEQDILTIEMSEIRQPEDQQNEDNETTAITRESTLVTDEQEQAEILPMVLIPEVNKIAGQGDIIQQDEGEDENTPQQKQHKSYIKRVELCIADKVKVIEAASTGRSQRQLAKQFGISKTQVQCLLKRREEILGYYKDGLGSWRKRARLRRTSEDINERVLLWYKQQVEQSNRLITGPMIQAKAISITRELGLQDVFKASNGWLESFKRRYDLPRKSNFYQEGVTMVRINPSSSNGRGTTQAEESQQQQQQLHHRQHREDDVELSENGRQSNEQTEGEPQQINNNNVYSMQNNMSAKQEQSLHITPSYSMAHIPYPIVYTQQRPPVSMPPPNNGVVMVNKGFSTPSTSAQVHKIDSVGEAFKYISALKEFSVERGSVTLIGLMTAMEHELQRENAGRQEKEANCKYQNQ
eukprot:gene8962-9918_t